MRERGWRELGTKAAGARTECAHGLLLTECVREWRPRKGVLRRGAVLRVSGNGGRARGPWLRWPGLCCAHACVAAVNCFLRCRWPGRALGTALRSQIGHSLQLRQLSS